MLKIGYDAKRLFSNRTGLGQYSRTLLNDLKLIYPEHQYHLFAPCKSGTLLNGRFSSMPFHGPSNPLDKLFFRSVSQVSKWQEIGIDIYHGLSNELPFLKRVNIPQVVSIHDVIFRSRPWEYPWVDRFIYFNKWKNAISRADVVVAISEYTANRLEHYYPKSRGKVKVIYQTCNNIFKEDLSEDYLSAVTKKYTLKDKFFLSVGSITERKNILSLLKAYFMIPLDRKNRFFGNWPRKGKIL